MTKTTPQEVHLLTVGEIARRLAVPLHRVEHVLRTRQDIKPRARAGALRVYDHAALAAIKSALAEQAPRVKKAGVG